MERGGARAVAGRDAGGALSTPAANPTMADGGSATAADSAPSRIRCRRMRSVTSPRPSPENGC